MGNDRVKDDPSKEGPSKASEETAAARPSYPGEMPALSPALTFAQAARVMFDRKVGAAPVVDRAGRLLGVMSVREVKPAPGALAAEEKSTIAHVARQMAERRVHHAVAVKPDGTWVGMFSAIDPFRWA